MHGVVRVVCAEHVVSWVHVERDVVGTCGTRGSARCTRKLRAWTELWSCCRRGGACADIVGGASSSVAEVVGGACADLDAFARVRVEVVRVKLLRKSVFE